MTTPHIPTATSRTRPAPASLAARMRMTLLAHRADPAPLRDGLLTVAMLLLANGSALLPTMAATTNGGSLLTPWRMVLQRPPVPPLNGLSVVEAMATLRRRRREKEV